MEGIERRLDGVRNVSSLETVRLHGGRYATSIGRVVFFVYYQEIKRDPNRKLIYECRCDETLVTSVMGECVI